ncbi:hypothetical protein BGW36DRAFT_456360 [Talaromyces proteolyticus]|uniref:CorA-like transporter domain-containing protein n=1 Tax=Talaromyces proteolyticus TaxID=1131652 RepID=A0AAD4KZH9_9EURO|nr:uncharacterized protein BGW36DRAFT_456360 [Talaromyces proteolyticus]KAH8704763.1 hypothetical protein BGW36DRAFT_456360 [Talaromyces proteolyticus]
MSPNFALHEKTLLSNEIDEKSRRIFPSSNADGQLEVLELWQGGDTRLLRNPSELTGYKETANGSSQLYIIRQKRTWAPLNISRQFLERFLSVHNVFELFWKVAFAFSKKSCENEFDFPGFINRQTRSEEQRKAYYYDYDELSYVVRRVELNGRSEIPGQSPWSIRQTGLYHKLQSRRGNNDNDDDGEKSTYLAIAPSDSFLETLVQYQKLAIEERQRPSPWHIHWLLMTDSLRGWATYISWLESELQQLTEPILLAEAGLDETQFRSDGFQVTFEDCQKLKQLDGYASDLKIILGIMAQNCIGVKERCLRYCRQTCYSSKNRCICSDYLDEFDRYVKEIKLRINQASILHRRIQSTMQLLTSFLDYEEANALNILAQESSKDSKKMSILTLRNTKDAIAVKILTIIGLVYLPTTIVLNFFSTVFVKSADGTQDMQVSPDVWILAAVAIPLTGMTIVLWWACLRFTTPLLREVELRQSKGAIASKLLDRLCRRRKRGEKNDLEMGRGIISLRQGKSSFVPIVATSDSCTPTLAGS